MAVKAMNNLVGLNGIMPILLVFGAYLRIVVTNVLSLLVTKRAKAI